ncbi:MAG: ABC transporter permease, partial [Oscillospiraceae bacterium]|nr:ABC transporter permease [Oscillospiraceae bacterium]
MRISDLLVMCVRNLTRRKLRTILTLIGVVIGTCMIIVMVSLVEGTQRRIDEMFSNFGDLTIIQVWPSWSGDGMTVLDDDALTQIAMIPG